MKDQPQTLVDILLSARDHGDRLCFAFVPEGADEADEQIDYATFLDRALRVAGGLTARGMGPGTHVAFVAAPRIEFVVTMAAVLLAGGVIIPVNHQFKRRELDAYLRTGGANAAVVDANTAALVAEVGAGLDDFRGLISTTELDGIDAVTVAELAQSDPAEPARPDPGDLAVLMHTSGTTGLPKAVTRLHGAYTAFANLWAERCMDPSDRVFSFMPMYHQAGFIVQWMPAFIHGAPFFQIERFSPVPFWATLHRYELTTGLFMPPVPHFLLLQPESAEDRDHPVKWAFGLSPPDVWTAFQERFDLPLHGGYGSTETTMVGMSGFRHDPPYPKDQLDLPLGGSVMGHPIPGWCDIRIADEDSNVVPPLTFGEVQIHGPGVLTEYYNNPEATKAAFTPDGWFKSGDIGYRAEDGRFVMVDRTKNLIRRSGENIAPAEVEEVLMDHPAIAEVAVVPVPDELRGQELRACIVLAEGAEVSPEDVYAYCEEELAGFKVPRFLEFCDELPHTPTFKVQKEQLVSNADPARWVDRLVLKKSAKA